MRRFALIAAGLLATQAAAASETWVIDSGRSRAHFVLHALAVVSLRGEAPISGASDNDALVARVPLVGLKMGNERHTRWALSAEFFDAERHPDVVFIADKLPVAELLQRGSVRGELRVRGESATVAFSIVEAQCPAAAAVCRLRMQGELSRRQFGMTSRRLTLSDRIQLELDLYLSRTP